MIFTTVIRRICFLLFSLHYSPMRYTPLMRYIPLMRSIRNTVQAINKRIFSFISNSPPQMNILNVTILICIKNIPISIFIYSIAPSRTIKMSHIKMAPTTCQSFIFFTNFLCNFNSIVIHKNNTVSGGL